MEKENRRVPVIYGGNEKKWREAPTRDDAGGGG